MHDLGILAIFTCHCDMQPIGITFLEQYNLG